MGGFSTLLSGTQAALRGHSWGGGQTQDFQAKRSLELARHALKHVPFYRKSWSAAGRELGDLRSMDDFRRLPITTKAQLQDAGTEVVADGIDARSLSAHETSGSSGQPLVIRRTAIEDSLLQAIRVQRRRQMHGLRWSDRRVTIRYGGDELWRPKLWSRFGVFRQRNIECRLPTAQLAAMVAESRPHVLSGYPCSLADIADTVGSGLRDLRCVISAGDMLSAATRRRISSGFGVPVYDAYGAHECNLLAQQCTRGVFHLA